MTNESIEIQINNNEEPFLYPNHFSIQDCLTGLKEIISTVSTNSNYSSSEKCWTTEKAISAHRNFGLRLK